MDFYNILQNELKVYINTIIMRVLFEGDKYGYEICKEIELRTHGQFKIKQPTLYSTLKRLEAQGFIKSYEDESLTHGGKRRYYSLTDLGTETFTKSQSDWEYSRTVMDRLISDKDADLASLPPVEPAKRMSRPKAKKAESPEETEVFIEEIEETEEKAEIIDEVPDAGMNESLVEIAVSDNQVYINEAEPEQPRAAEDDYTQLCPRPVQEATYAAYNTPSYTDDLKNQVFVADPATSININDTDFTSLLYEINPYDSAETAPVDEDEAVEAADAVEERQSDAVFLPPPDFEQKKGGSAALLDDEDVQQLSEKEQAQNYIEVEYKNILSRFIRYEPGAAAAAGGTVTVNKQPAIRAAHTDGLDDIKVRQHDKKANLQYTKKFYVYISRLSLMKNSILSAVMLAEVLVFFLVFDVILGRVIQAEKGYYGLAIIVSCLPSLYSLIAYFINPVRKKRISNSYFENLLINIIIAVVAMVAVYLACGLAFGMNVNNFSDFYLRLGLFAALGLNFIVSSVMFCIIHRTKRYAV